MSLLTEINSQEEIQDVLDQITEYFQENLGENVIMSEEALNELYGHFHVVFTIEDLATLCCSLEDTNVMEEILLGEVVLFDPFDCAGFNGYYGELAEELEIN